MARRKTAWALLLICCPVVSGAAERLAVLEFFGRPGCAYCSAAGPTMRSLQAELTGRAVLLEYHYDSFGSGRKDRFWASGAAAQSLPLAMVGSGYLTRSGPVDYAEEYGEMLAAEMARPPRARVSAWWRGSGATIRAYVAVQNSGSGAIRSDLEAAAWVIVYEEAAIGVSDTWVRATTSEPLDHDLLPRESAALVIDVSAATVSDWSRVSILVLVEDRPGGSGRYDMLQAVVAVPAELDVTPAQLHLSRSEPTGLVMLEGPHVLAWNATSDVPWLEVTPSGDGLPATATVTQRPELRPTGETSGTLTLTAEGDGMRFESRVDVRVGNPSPRRANGRRRPLD